MNGRAIGIGASAGGLDALCGLVQRLPRGLPVPVFVVLHTRSDGPGYLPDILARAGPLPAAYARDREIIEPRRIYVAPADHHLLVRPGGYLHLSQGPREHHTRPAIDPTFRSMARVYGPGAIGVVLSGYLDDGTAGLLAIKDCGGEAIVQDPREAGVSSMPATALHGVLVDHCCGVAEMGPLLANLVRDPPRRAPAPQALRHIEIEDLIAERGVQPEDWQILSRLSSPTALRCPECGHTLCRLHDARVTRYRCEEGHAFTVIDASSGPKTQFAID